MSTMRLVSVSCDGCADGLLHTAEDSPAEARRVAAGKGWTIGTLNKRAADLCPDCKACPTCGRTGPHP